MLNFQKPVMCLLGAQETFLIIIKFENSCAATVNYAYKHYKSPFNQYNAFFLKKKNYI